MASPGISKAWKLSSKAKRASWKISFFPPEGGVLHPDNLYHRYFLPCLEHAGLRRIRFHDLRHTFGSLLIQGGASLTYVKDQMGHSSIQVTVDIYGHLLPGANVSYVDRLDSEIKPQKSATPAQQPVREEPESIEVLPPEVVEMMGVSDPTHR